VTAPDPGGALPDPGIGVLAQILDKALSADPADYHHAGMPWRLWRHASLVLEEIDKARAEYGAIDAELEEIGGGLL
jgi:hypothetical protein